MRGSEDVKHHVVVVRAGRVVDMSCVCGWHVEAPAGARTPTSREAYDLHVSTTAAVGSR